jgi:RNA polymerase sigma-70 factor (ECF subfamily)
LSVDAAAFAAALRPLLRPGAAYAASLLGGRADAEDAVQQAALRAWERRGQYDPRYPFRAWWFAILRHHCLDAWRRRARIARAAPPGEEVVVVPQEAVLDRIALEKALGALTAAHAAILRLRYYGDLDYAEIAFVLKIPKGTVMSRLHLARRALAGVLAREEP